MRVTTADLRGYKERGERFACLTAYDVVTARIADESDIPLLLVGDSLGMVVLGYENTIPVTLDEVLHHTRAVLRGSQRALIVADMPFMTYHRSVAQAVENAGRCLQEGGAQAVKLEGGRTVAETVGRLTSIGVPVMGHIGLTPQSVNQLGGFKVQGKSLERAKELVRDAHALQDAGAFSIVLECVPSELARRITERLTIPTIGIGAGPHCDAEIQVVSDILGWIPSFVPKHTKPYAHLADAARDALGRYRDDVLARGFPGPAQSFTLSEEVLREIDDDLSISP